MQGYLLDFLVKENTGYISGDDGKRYEFDGREWKENAMPCRGARLDFDVDGSGRAIAVFLGMNQKPSSWNEKDTGPLSPQIQKQVQDRYEIEKNYSVLDWFGKCWRGYINFEGRARRKEFWSFQLCYVAIDVIGVMLFLLALTGGVTDSSDGGIFDDMGLSYFGFMGLLVTGFSVLNIILFIPNIAVAVRRLHDINLSGWWLLLHFIPVGVCAVWILFCIDTNRETNAWGPPAKPV